MVTLALSICSLLELELFATVIFTLVFAGCGYAAIIYFKLRFAFYEDECDAIRRGLEMASRIYLRIHRALLPRTSAKMCCMLCKCIALFIFD